MSMKPRWIRCKVLPGMLASERLVLIEEAEGREVASIFVDESLVEVDDEPKGDHPVSGRLQVEIGRISERMNVFLPVASAEHGRVLCLPAALLLP